MRGPTSSRGCYVLLATVLLVAGCTEPTVPDRRDVLAPLLATTGGGGITLDQVNGSLGESGLEMRKGFNPVNPHTGDAIIATFFWVGPNTITSVTDYLATEPVTPVGNAYTLVEQVTEGSISMATYVATNVQNFPDAYSDPAGDSILVVKATFALPVADGGLLISAWIGVNSVSADALGAHRSASGTASGTTVTGPGAIPVNAGGLAYAVTMTNAVVGMTGPEGFTSLGRGSDLFVATDGEHDAAYAVLGEARVVDPRWTWFFTALPSTWLASALALNSAPPPTGDPLTTTPSSGTTSGGGKVGDGRDFATLGLEASATGGKVQWVQHCLDGPRPGTARCESGGFTFRGTVAPDRYTDVAGSPTCRRWSGTGTARFKDAPSRDGTYDFTVNLACDNGEPGRGDFIDITIDAYHAAQRLSGGNLQLEP